MDYFNPQCPTHRCGQNPGTFIPDTDCGVPPTTIMPRTTAPCKGQKAGAMRPAMPERTMKNTMTQKNMRNTMPERTMGSMMPDNTMGTVMPGNTMGNMMPGNTMGSMMPDNTIGTVMPGNTMGNMMPDNSMWNMMPDRLPFGNAGMCNEEMMQNFPVAMAYVPWQRWQQLYSLEEGFKRGTIFPDLDLPFIMGRCQ